MTSSNFSMQQIGLKQLTTLSISLRVHADMCVKDLIIGSDVIRHTQNISTGGVFQNFECAFASNGQKGM